MLPSTLVGLLAEFGDNLRRNDLSFGHRDHEDLVFIGPELKQVMRTAVEFLILRTSIYVYLYLRFIS